MTTFGEDAEEPLSGPFEIYETADGPRHVGNPMRRQILAKMRGRELTVPEMIDATSLSKSTISTHLSILYQQKLVAYREDPDDRRRKLYYLTSRHVGTARRCGDRIELVDPGRDLPIEQGLAGGVVLRLLLRGFLTELSCCGLDLEPVARETGRRVGELVGRDRRAQDMPALAQQLSRFWGDAGLGTIRVLVGSDDQSSARVIVEDCRVCCAGATAAAGTGLSAITAGLIEGMASESLRTMVAVRLLDDADAADNGPPSACGCRFELSAPALLTPVGDQAH